MKNCNLKLNTTNDLYFFLLTLARVSPWTKPYGVTIQMKPLYLYLHMVLLVFQDFTKQIWDFLLNFTFGHIW